MADVPSPIDLSAVPLFPLPNVVLFPRAVLPLHIFEERYKAMTARALAGDRLIGMALLKSGWEKSYYGRAAIESVVCVGRILSHERLPDGCYNFLLQGLTRARVARELVSDEPFRQASLQPIGERPALEVDLEDQRRRLEVLFDRGGAGASGAGRQFRKLLNSPITTADLADLIAFYLLDDVWLKQSLLSDDDVRRRVCRSVDAIEQCCASVPQAYGSAGDPSLN